MLGGSFFRRYLMCNKPFLTFTEQAELLVSRGMTSITGLSRDELIASISQDLSFINYYRFSAYWFPFYVENEKGEIELTYIFQ